MDFTQEPTPGDVEEGIVNVVVEIPTGSINKIEWNRDEEIMQLDRIEASAEPDNYGFIPKTLNADGDELDAVIINERSLPTGVQLKVRVVGVMKFEDEGVVDDKIIVVPEDARGIYKDINNINDIPKFKIDQLTYYFNHSKDFISPNLTIVKGWGSKIEAKRTILRAIKTWDEAQKN
jgi:inorganic pyrophosphatase